MLRQGADAVEVCLRLFGQIVSQGSVTVRGRIPENPHLSVGDVERRIEPVLDHLRCDERCGIFVGDPAGVARNIFDWPSR